MRRQKATTTRLRHKLWLQKEVTAEDGVGGYITTWKNMVEVWAEIVPLNGKEHFASQQVQTEVTHRVLLRYRTGVTAGMRLLHEGRAFNIRLVMNVDELGDTLEIAAQEGVAQ